MAATVESTYANAFFEIALEHGNEPHLFDTFGQLDAVLQQNSGLIQLLSSPIITGAEKSAVIDTVFAGRLHVLLIHFLKVLCQNGRIALFHTIYEQCLIRHNTLHGIIPITAVTAVAMPTAFQRKLQDALAHATGQTVVLKNGIDPSVIGGVMLQSGNMQIDGTLKAQLEQIRSKMKQMTL